jgi:hypothetical protein
MHSTKEKRIEEMSDEKRDVYYQIEDECGEAVGEIDCMEMKEDESIDALIEKVKRRKKVLNQVASEDVEVELVSVEEKEEVCLLFCTMI